MRHRVVLVDDAVDLRTLVGLACRRDGRLEVVAGAGDGAAGIAAVEQHRPDLVLMDVAMPVMDGLTATRQLKEAFPGLPVVVFTGYDDGRVEAEARLAGADAFVDKATPLAEVVELLLSVLSRSG